MDIKVGARDPAGNERYHSHGREWSPECTKLISKIFNIIHGSKYYGKG